MFPVMSAALDEDPTPLRGGEGSAKGHAGGPYRLFISYRRDDNLDFVEHIRSWFAWHFGRANVFMDFESIPAGANFPEHIQVEIERCDGLLAIIGPSWLQRLLAGFLEERDYVREEIALALKLNKLVVPICIKGAVFPEKLPLELRAMRPSQRASLEPGRYFARNIEDLVVEIHGVLSKRITRKNLVDELEIISPSAGLGLGYYINFVKPVVSALSQLTSLSIDGKQIDTDEMRLHIMVPPRLHLLKPTSLLPLSSILKQVSIHPGGSGRPFALRALPIGADYQLVDFPSPIMVVENWLARRMSQERVDPESDQALRLEREEIYRFESTLKWWIEDQANDPSFQDRVRVVHFDAARPDLEWLAGVWTSEAVSSKSA